MDWAALFPLEHFGCISTGKLVRIGLSIPQTELPLPYFTVVKGLMGMGKEKEKGVISLVPKHFPLAVKPKQEQSSYSLNVAHPACLKKR